MTRWVVEKHFFMEEQFKMFQKCGVWKPYHITTFAHHIAHPPLNPHYYLFGIYDSIEEASKATKKDLQEFISKANLTGKETRKISLGTRFNIFQRDNYCCQICGKNAQEGARLEVDHKIPVAKDGNDSNDNLWTLCFECNRGKGVKSL